MAKDNAPAPPREQPHYFVMLTATVWKGTSERAECVTDFYGPMAKQLAYAAARGMNMRYGAPDDDKGELT